MTTTDSASSTDTAADDNPTATHHASELADSDYEEYPWRNRELLEELYVERELTTREIADLFDASNGTISRWLNIHDIPTRDNWRAGVEAARRATRVERVKMRTLPSGYEYWGSTERNGDSQTRRVVYVHRLLAVAEYGFDAVAGKDVHHGAGPEGSTTPWDNRPENIELMGKNEHGRHHSRQYWESGSA